MSNRAVQEGLSEEATFQLRLKEKPQPPEATGMLRKKKIFFNVILQLFQRNVPSSVVGSLIFHLTNTHVGFSPFQEAQHRNSQGAHPWLPRNSPSAGGAGGAPGGPRRASGWTFPPSPAGASHVPLLSIRNAASPEEMGPAVSYRPASSQK